jgi:lysozyme
VKPRGDFPVVLTNTVIDIYNGTHVADDGFHQLANAGIEAVIHKATQGLDFADASYDARRKRVGVVGLLWGAYHFASDDDPVQQADHFLLVANPGPNDLMVLDFEPNHTQGTMTRAQAEAFVDQIHQHMGRFPTVYAGLSFLTSAMSGHSANSPLKNCPLWIAVYPTHSNYVPQVPAPWTAFKLWQYTDGNNGPQPHQVPGIGPCDRDKFNGDSTQLKNWWGT